MPAAAPQATRIRSWRVGIPKRRPRSDATEEESRTIGPSLPIAPAEATVSSEERLFTNAGRKCRTPSRRTTASRISQPRIAPVHFVPAIRARPANSEPIVGTDMRNHQGDSATARTRFGSAVQIRRGNRVARPRKPTAAPPARTPTQAAHTRSRVLPEPKTRLLMFMLSNPLPCSAISVRPAITQDLDLTSRKWPVARSPRLSRRTLIQ